MGGSFTYFSDWLSTAKGQLVLNDELYLGSWSQVELLRATLHNEAVYRDALESILPPRSILLMLGIPAMLAGALTRGPVRDATRVCGLLLIYVFDDLLNASVTVTLPTA